MCSPQAPTLRRVAFLWVELSCGISLFSLCIWDALPRKVSAMPFTFRNTLFAPNLPGKIWKMGYLVGPPDSGQSPLCRDSDRTYICSTVSFFRIRAPVIGLLPSFSKAARTCTYCAGFAKQPAPPLWKSLSLSWGVSAKIGSRYRWSLSSAFLEGSPGHRWCMDAKFRFMSAVGNILTASSPRGFIMLP